ncbi:MAG: MFS transporter [Acidimicrobiales bacterium]
MTTATIAVEARDGDVGHHEAMLGGQRALRVLIYAVCLASATFQQGIVPLLPAYAHRFGLSGVETGMLLAATALSTMAVSLPAGALSDRLGARRLTILAGWLMAAAMLVEAFAPSFSVLLLARLVFGAGYGIVWTAGLAWLAGVSPQGSGLGGTVAASGVGGILGPLLAGSLAGLVGMAAPFYMAAAVFLSLTMLLSWLRLPNPARERAPSGFRSSAGGMLRNRGIVVAAAAVVVAGLTWSVTYLLGPQELHASGVSTATIGLVLSAAAAVFVIGSMATTSFGQRAVRARWILLAIAGAAVAFVPGIVGSAPFAITAMICAAAVARSVLWTVCYPLAARGAERMGIGVGVVMGFLQAVWATTSVISPLAAGGLAGVLSSRQIFALGLLGCLAILAGTVAWLSRHPLGAWLRGALARTNLAA